MIVFSSRVQSAVKIDGTCRYGAYSRRASSSQCCARASLSFSGVVEPS